VDEGVPQQSLGYWALEVAVDEASAGAIEAASAPRMMTVRVVVEVRPALSVAT
jgi:hypothetical protein